MQKTGISGIVLVALGAAILLCVTRFASANEYEIDPTHSFVEFRIKHLGYSWLHGRFNDISGTFKHDPAKPGENRIDVVIDAASVDTNHAERDKHLRSEDFLAVDEHPEATFTATSYVGTASSGLLTGDLTLRGVTKPVTIEVRKIGEGPDPWGGHRAGFEGRVEIVRRDFDIAYDLGPVSETVELTLGIEGVRK